MRVSCVFVTECVCLFCSQCSLLLHEIRDCSASAIHLHCLLSLQLPFYSDKHSGSEEDNPSSEDADAADIPKQGVGCASWSCAHVWCISSHTVCVCCAVPFILSRTLLRSTDTQMSATCPALYLLTSHRQHHLAHAGAFGWLSSFQQ